MKPLDTEKLKHLLGQHPSNALAERCTKAFPVRPDDNDHSTAPLDLQEIRRIYALRAKLNQQQKGEIEGFDDLLLGLEGATDKIVIHSFQAEGDRFIIFTNDDMTCLIGLLVSPYIKPDGSSGIQHR